MSLISRLLRRTRETKYCSRSLKPPPKKSVYGFQGRVVCPNCDRAIHVSTTGRFTRHLKIVKGRDYLDPTWKGFR